jgi:hypothetical protein
MYDAHIDAESILLPALRRWSPRPSGKLSGVVMAERRGQERKTRVKPGRSISPLAAPILRLSRGTMEHGVDNLNRLHGSSTTWKERMRRHFAPFAAGVGGMSSS